MAVLHPLRLSEVLIYLIQAKTLDTKFQNLMLKNNCIIEEHERIMPKRGVRHGGLVTQKVNRVVRGRVAKRHLLHNVFVVGALEEAGKCQQSLVLDRLLYFIAFLIFYNWQNGRVVEDNDVRVRHIVNVVYGYN